MAIKKKLREDSQQMSISLPKSMVEEIEIICKSQYISRTSWMFSAAKEKLEKTRLEKIKKLQREEEKIA